MATLKASCLSASLALSLPAQGVELVFNTYLDPPYVIQDQRELAGVNIEVYELLKKHSNLDISIRLLPLKRAYLMALESPNNCVFAIERSQARESSFTWISPMYISRYAIYQPQQSFTPLSSVADLQQLKIGSYLGSGIGEYLESLGVEVDLAKTNLNSAKKLQRQRTQAWASDILSSAYVHYHYSLGIQKQGFDFYSSLRAIACNKDSDAGALQKLQTSLNQLQKSGKISNILASYEQQYQVDLGL